MFKAFAIAGLGLAMLPGAASAMDWGSFYVDVYGGSRLAGESTYYDIHDVYVMTPGYAAGVTVGMQTSVEGLAVELDVMRTTAPYDGDWDYTLETTSVMGGANYTAMLGDNFGVYFGAGVGVVNITYNSTGTLYPGSGFGYQLEAGLIANVTDNVAIFAEIKKQDTFTYVDIDGDDVSSPSLNALVGLRLSMN
jgi:opacity protein-like surface antigen